VAPTDPGELVNPTVRVEPASASSAPDVSAQSVADLSQKRASSPRSGVFAPSNSDGPAFDPWAIKVQGWLSEERSRRDLEMPLRKDEVMVEVPSLPGASLPRLAQVWLTQRPCGQGLLVRVVLAPLSEADESVVESDPDVKAEGCFIAVNVGGKIRLRLLGVEGAIEKLGMANRLGRSTVSVAGVVKDWSTFAVNADGAPLTFRNVLLA